MHALLPIILTASHVLLAAELGTEIRCRADMSAGGGSGGVAGPRFGGVTAG